MFSEYDNTLSPTILAFFQKIIKPLLAKFCKPVPSNKCKPAIPLHDLLAHLKSHKIKVLSLVLNFSHKIIGVHTSLCFVPCYPSEVITVDKVAHTFIDDYSLWTTYDKTIQGLTKVGIKPKYAVVEDEYVVGVLTETDQFVQTSPPISMASITLDLPVLRQPFMTSSTKQIDTYIEQDDGKGDVVRETHVNNIKTETDAFAKFRTTIKLGLTDKLKQQLVETDDVAVVEELLKTHVSTTVEPAINLITGKSNQIGYYQRIADEIVRNKRVRQYMLNKDEVFMTASQMEYQLLADELLIPFDKLEEMEKREAYNPYIKHISYDDATTQQGVEPMVVADPHVIGYKEEVIPTAKIATPLSSSIWKKLFAPNTMEYVYDAREQFGDNIMEILEEEYTKYPIDKVVAVMNAEGRKITVADFPNVFKSVNYYISVTDIWILVEKYKIPTIFISQKPILQTGYSQYSFIGYSNNVTEPHMFILISPPRAGVIPTYAVLHQGDTNLIVLKDTCPINNGLSVATFITNYVKQAKPVVKAHNVTVKCKK